MQNLNTYATTYRKSKGKTDIPPMNDRTKLSIPKKSNIIFSMEHNANSIGITFNAISISLYQRLLTDFSTFSISSSAR